MKTERKVHMLMATLAIRPLPMYHYHRPFDRRLHALPAVRMGVKGDAADMDV